MKRQSGRVFGVFLNWFTGLFGLGLAVVASVCLYLGPVLPTVETLKDVRLQTPLRVYTKDHKLIAEFGDMWRTPIQFKEVPQQLVYAFMAAEDDRFYQHHGVDLFSLMRAGLQLVTSGRIQTGGSTITMQVAKNFFLSRRRAFSRKFNEILLALQIERELSKTEIMELYLNKIYLGNRAYGVQAAAQVYYGKTVDKLDLAQLAMIAVLPKAPSRYNPLNDPDRSLMRRDWILGRMLELQYINKFEYDEAIIQPITAKYHGNRIDLEAPYVAEMVRQEMVDRYGTDAYSTGFNVYTTIDSKLQIAAIDAVAEGLMDYNERHGYFGSEENLIEQGKEKKEEWQEFLNDVSDKSILQPAIVSEVRSNDIDILLRDNRINTIEWENLVWAKPFINVDAFGKDPLTASEIVKRGDFIWVRSMPDDKMRLAQIPVSQAALVSVDPRDGSILAMIGGFNFYDSMYNRAEKAVRQAGSAFKPFVYAAGVDSGMTAATIMNDAPIVFQDGEMDNAWRPNNDNMRFNGPMRLREGLYRSRNLISIRVLQRTGLHNALRYLKNLGFKDSNLAKDLSLALGNVSVTPLELTSGFAVIANGGYQVIPYLIHSIKGVDEVFFSAVRAVAGNSLELEKQDIDDMKTTDDEGDKQVASNDDNGLFQYNTSDMKARRVMDARVNFIINDILKDVIWKGTGKRVQVLERHDIGGKTGTTNENKDVWFVGFTPNILTTVWMGMDDSTTLGRWEYGANSALPIWLKYMTSALVDQPEYKLPQPDGLVTLKIDISNGKLARKGDENAIFEIFRKEYAPTVISDEHSSVIDSDEHVVSPEDIF